MLRHTFIHLKGVGRQFEHLLWREGVSTWGELLALDRRVRGLGPARHRALSEGVRLSEERLALKDAAFFHQRLPTGERWRLAPDFAGRIAFLDIETTGMGAYAETTVVGVLAAGRPRLFVRGINLDDFPAFIEGHDVWVTFNGACFDEPFLRREFGERVRPSAHVDLRFCLRAAGHSGGLKRIEKALGIARPDGVRDLDGWDAVRLWGEHLAGSRDSLRQLLAYNIEDVLNLEPLLEVACRLGVGAASGCGWVPAEAVPADGASPRELAEDEVERMMGLVAGG